MFARDKPPTHPPPDEIPPQGDENAPREDHGDFFIVQNEYIAIEMSLPFALIMYGLRTRIFFMLWLINIVFSQPFLNCTNALFYFWDECPYFKLFLFDLEKKDILIINQAFYLCPAN